MKAKVFDGTYIGKVEQDADTRKVYNGVCYW